jgi:hypothetical protein
MTAGSRYPAVTARAMAVLVAALAGLWLCGCATPPDDRESDMPWSTPQSWEGTIPMPGMEMNR